MSAGSQAFEGFALEETIASRAASIGIALAPGAVASIAGHARAVMGANERLHLTTILGPAEFVERHIGESLEGAAMLDAEAAGTLLDLGSGNGYPGVPLAAARPGLAAVLADASARKAEFLRDAIREAGLEGTRVLERQVQRAADVPELAGLVRVVSTRAAGGWERIVPRLLPCLAPGGEFLIWAGDDLDAVRGRVIWRRLELVERRPLPGRDRSWVWRFRAATPGS